MNEQQLIEKLLAIERLYAGATTEGERLAAANARERVRRRLAEFQRSDPEIEFKFSLHDPWTRRLFLALLRRYQLRPYRYRRQRRVTIMVKVPRRFVDEVLWPEFEKLSSVLREYLEEVTVRVISEGIAKDSSDADEVEGGTPAQLVD